MLNVRTQKGQSLVEILFAIAIFTIGVVTIGYLIFDSFTSLGLREDSVRARLLAQEGIEAARLLRGPSFDALLAGSYGLAFVDGEWALSETPDEIGKFQRTLTVSDDAHDIKNVRVEIAWEAYGRTRTAILETHLSNWRGTYGEAKDIVIDGNNAVLSASSTSLGGIALLNTGEHDVTIEGLKVQWEGTSMLENILIRTNSVFTASSSKIASGEYIDIDDYLLETATGYHLMDFQFDNAVVDTDFVITVLFSDESERHAVINLAP